MSARLRRNLSRLCLALLLAGCGGGGGGGGGNGGGDIITVEPAREATLLAHVSTRIGDTRVDGVLSPGKEAIIGTLDLEDADATIAVEVSGGAGPITPDQVSLGEQQILFTAPAGVVAGELTVTIDGVSSASLPYRVFTADAPHLTSIEPELAAPGDTVTLRGSHLPNLAAEVVLQGAGGSLRLPVTPTSDQVQFVVPDTARSGLVYLEMGQMHSNKLYLAVQRHIDIQVSLASGLSFSPGDISLPVSGVEYPLDANYSARVPVDNERPQFIHAMHDAEDGEPALLYSAIVLADTTGVVTLDPHSTAIAWVFLGMGATAVMDGTELRALYNRAAADAEVSAFAAHIATLQAGAMVQWETLSDPALREKYQAALRSILLAATAPRPARRSAADGTANPLVQVTQDPENANVYFDLTRNDGSVTLVNDTKLYLSVEARSSADGTVVNGYQHVSDVVGMLSDPGVVGPKGWGLLGIASEKRLDLSGTDAHLEVVLGAYGGSTDQTEVVKILRARVFIDGLVTPALNMMISTLMDERIADGIPAKGIIEAMADIYGAGFLSQVVSKVSDHTTSWAAIADTLVIMPMKSGYSACFQIPPGTACQNLMRGLAKLIGVEVADKVVEKLLLKIYDTAEKRIVKRSLVLVPVVGWVVQASFLVYDNIGYVSDSATIAESIYDMNHNPQQIDAEVTFALKVGDVQPRCAGAGPSDSALSFDLTGRGLVAADGTEPFVQIGTGDDVSDAALVLAEDDGSALQAVFTVGELLDEGSWEDSLFVGYDGSYWIMYDQPVRIVDQNDPIVYFDAVEPPRGYPGDTVVLLGCGWIPLEELKVYFTAASGEVEAEILSRAIDTVEVAVPAAAVSGAVYATAGNKTTRKLYFDVDPFSLTGADTDSVVAGSSVVLDGNSLTEVAAIQFVDAAGTRAEGTIVYTSDDSVRVGVPSGLGYGDLTVYAQSRNGTESNALPLTLVPGPVDAAPSGQVFAGSIEVTLTQAEGADIFYRVDDGDEQAYTGPLTLYAADAQYEYFSLYAFARAVVDGSAYESRVLEYQYTPCAENEVVEDGMCVAGEPPSGGSGDCPTTYDPLLGNDDGDILLNSQDKDGDGWPEDRTRCSYWWSGSLASESTFVDDGMHGPATYYYESGATRTTTTYVNGYQDGLRTEFFESGTTKSERQYSAGLINGFERLYFDNGQLAEETYYLNGVPHGESRSYNNSGVMWSCIIYSHGEFAGSCMP